jgi:hypothetical protein
VMWFDLIRGRLPCLRPVGIALTAAAALVNTVAMAAGVGGVVTVGMWMMIVGMFIMGCRCFTRLYARVGPPQLPDREQRHDGPSRVFGPPLASSGPAPKI